MIQERAGKHVSGYGPLFLGLVIMIGSAIALVPAAKIGPGQSGWPRRTGRERRRPGR